MSWGSYQSQAIVESPAGSGAATNEITLNPGEKAHVFVTRTDGSGAGDPWLIAIQGSIKDAPDYAEDPPLREYRLDDTQTEVDFIVAGPFAFRIYVENDGTDTDVVAATVGWRKDGVSI